MKISNKNIQRVLQAAGYYNGPIDGDIGNRTRRGIQKVLENRSGDISDERWQTWPWDRKAIAAVQIVLLYAGHEPGPIDGWDGTLTQGAFYDWQYERTHGKKPDPWRDDDYEQNNDAPLQDNEWPLQSQMTRYFGEPGGPQCTAGKVQLPFKMKLAWNDQIISRFSCHELVADSAQRVLERVASEYSPEDISRLGFDIFGGCYNFRKKRGGTTLSTHAYGAAIDIDPIRNQLKWKADRASLAIAECKTFWELWEAEGWISLGRARNYDWMHVQAARL